MLMLMMNDDDKSTTTTTTTTTTTITTGSEVAQVHRSPGFITSNLVGKSADGSLIKDAHCNVCYITWYLGYVIVLSVLLSLSLSLSAGPLIKDAPLLRVAGPGRVWPRSRLGLPKASCAAALWVRVGVGESVCIEVIAHVDKTIEFWTPYLVGHRLRGRSQTFLVK